MTEFGFTNPVLIDEQKTIIAGHGRTEAAKALGMDVVPCVMLKGLTDAQKRAYCIADNQLPMNAGWDLDVLKTEVLALQQLEFDTDVLGFTADFLDNLLADAIPAEVPEPLPGEVPAEPHSVLGDVWLLDGHRVMCGDSTSPTDVERLVGGEKAELMHADPPYGMGKQSDGVQNDNLYKDKLDQFQMDWWNTWRGWLVDNASAYIWGNAAELWRLWYVGGLGASEQLEMQNEIVWDKGGTAGRGSDALVSYQTGSERALFFQIGKQYLGNVNAEDYFEGWEPIRGYLVGEAERAGVTPTRCREITGVQMYSHWFTKSQWTMMPEKHYRAFAEACPGAFTKPYAEIRATYEKIKTGYRDKVDGVLSGMRAYFDNTHDAAYDVWTCQPVFGEERHGHATPKPVELMKRVMMSSLSAGGLCFEPFGGSGSTLIGAQATGRRCYTMELTPGYVDVIVKRWQEMTGKAAVHLDDGRVFNG